MPPTWQANVLTSILYLHLSGFRLPQKPHITDIGLKHLQADTSLGLGIICSQPRIAETGIEPVLQAL